MAALVTLRACFIVGPTDNNGKMINIASTATKLISVRNPLSHYRRLDDASNLSRRAVDSRTPAVEHLMNDATFAISVAVRLLVLPGFRLDR